MYSSIKNILLFLSNFHQKEILGDDTGDDDRHNDRRKDDDGDSMKVLTN